MEAKNLSPYFRGQSKSKTQFKMKLSKLFRISLLYFAFFCINCSSDYTENLGNGYFFVGEGEPLNKILNKKSDRGVIPENVNDYDFDKNFIIAKQKPELPQSILYEKKYEYKDGPNEYYYWLIIKNEYRVLGPYNISEFNYAKEIYNVPNTLKLK